jgi:hypothetical protein
MAIGTAAAILGAGALGAAGSAFAASKASKAQQRAAQQGIDAQQRMFDRQVELQEPFRQAGITSQNQLLTLLGLPGGAAGSAEYGSLTRPFGMDQFQADPGYGFRMSEGMKALERSAAARGGLLSGSTLKGVSRFGQDLASQEYQNAFNRYQIERQARLNPLQSLMGAGQSSTNTLTGAAGQLGQGLAQGYGNLGQARASSYVGMGNALTGALGQGVNSYMGMQYLNAMNPAASASATPYAYGAGGYTGMGPFIGG